MTAPSMGRFGTSISGLADMNGDGLRDIAVGAPMEDSMGAVYIYLGDRHKGIRDTFSQVTQRFKILKYNKNVLFCLVFFFTYM